MFTSKMMKEVHRIAANLEGDYSARLVLAFREVNKNEELSNWDVVDMIEAIAEAKYGKADVKTNTNKEIFTITVYETVKLSRGRKERIEVAKIQITKDFEIITKGEKIFTEVVKGIKIYETGCFDKTKAIEELNSRDGFQYGV